jgi:hypothetical protein
MRIDHKIAYKFCMKHICVLTVVVVVHVSGGRYVSELWPPVGLLFVLQVIQEYGEPRWNDINRGKLKNLDKNLSHCHFVHHRYHMD